MVARETSTLNVSLTPQLQAFVAQKVESGRYQSASEVVREALRALEERDRTYEAHLEELRRDIRVGLGQLNRGQKTPFDKSTIAWVRSEGRKRLRQARKKPAK